MAVTSTQSVPEQDLLDAARAGDETAFARIVEEHRTELHAHCYRMLGSVHDAEDALQETFLRAWRGLSGFAGRSSLRTWLYRIATNVCLDAAARGPKRGVPSQLGPPADRSADPGQPLVESVWVEPYPDDALALPNGYSAPDARYEQREAVELAFIAALQHLPAAQRAVLILREVLGFSSQEVSESLDTSVASVNSSLQRARKAVAERLPERSQQETLRSVGDSRVRTLVEAYVAAWAKGDVDAVARLLAADAAFSMPPWAMWWRGRETIAAFAEEAVDCVRPSSALPIRASGQVAVAYWSPDAETGRQTATAIDVLTFEGELITEITAFITPEIFPLFGLPTELDPGEEPQAAVLAGWTGKS
jgi:RNA polymerase sigma-70 factor (ECF subfamily)